MPLWNPSGMAVVGEGHITIMPYAYNSVTGTWTSVVSSLHAMGFYTRNTPAATDNITYKVYLSAGTYSLRMVAEKSDNFGKSKISIGGTQVAQFDWYDAATSYGNVQTETGIVITIGSLKDLLIETDEKNAASSNYACWMNCISLWRTA